eukprot:756974-Hanusia_phi.AAC.6
MAMKHIPIPTTFSVEWGEKEAPNESKIHRAPGYEKELVCLPFADEPSINTIPACVKRAKAKKDRSCPVSESIREWRDEEKCFNARGRINRSEWTKTLYAAWSYRIVAVPLYDTLMPNAVSYIVNHAELTTVCTWLCDAELTHAVDCCGTVQACNDPQV